MIAKKLLIVLLVFLQLSLSGQLADPSHQRLPEGVQYVNYNDLFRGPAETVTDRIDPPFWWSNMPDTKLQLLIHSKNIKGSTLKLSDKRIKLIKLEFLNNPNYAVVYLDLKKVKTSLSFDLSFNSPYHQRNFRYEIKTREEKTNLEPIGPHDLLYLIMPDRFANGNYSNDTCSEMLQHDIDRSKMYFRHGGDLEGVLQHLRYLDNTHITAIWLNPALENNQGYESYHGYAITDHYRIDPRFGNNETYKVLALELHKRKMKLVKDLILNHCGSNHYFIKDLADVRFIHKWDTFTRTNYNVYTFFDSINHAYDQKKLIEGWFDRHMPDLNQNFSIMGDYLIQHAIWWAEYAHLDGLRIDTWFYSDRAFMGRFIQAMNNYNPKLNIFAEAWVNNVALLQYFTGEEYLGIQKQYPSPIDFSTCFAIHDAVNNAYSWDGGVSRLHNNLSQDALYKNQKDPLVFLDNHDMDRIFSRLHEDLSKWKQAIGILLTIRGIPSLYYGTEVLMKNYSNPDGKVREDFPGGWIEDEVNFFNTPALQEERKEAYEYLTTLTKYRKINASFFKNANFIQELPTNGVYCFCRNTNDKTLISCINTENKTMRKNISELNINKKMQGKDILSKVSVQNSFIEIEPKGIRIIEYK